MQYIAIKSDRFFPILAVACLAFGASFTAFVFARHSVDLARHQKFIYGIENLKEKIEKRLDFHFDLLNGVQGLYAASAQVDRDEFAAFAKKMMQTQPPQGLIAIGYAERVSAADLPAFLDEVRNDKSVNPDGYPGFAINPQAERSEYWVIKYYENISGSDDALGLDFLSKNMRKIAVETARDTGAAAASRPFSVSAENNAPHNDFMIVLPIYKSGAPVDNPEERRAAFKGAVFSIMDYDALFHNILSAPNLKFIRGITLLEDSEVLYQSDPDLNSDGDDKNYFTSAIEINAFQQAWTLNVFGFKIFDADSTIEHYLPRAVLFGGCVISMLVIAICHLLLSSRSRAEKIAQSMTEALRQERDHSARIIMETPAVICKIAPDGTGLFMNPAGEKVTGYKASEIIGKNFWHIFYPGPDYIQVENMFREFEKGNVRDYEMTLTAKDGQLRTIAWNSVNRYNVHGKIAEIIGFGYDLTEKKALEGQLRQSQKMEAVGKLAGGVAHEINNPLAVILGFAQGLAKRLPPDDPSMGPIQWIEKEALRCKKLVEDLLTFSRSGKEEKHPIDLNLAIEGALALVRLQGKIKDIQIVKELTADLPRVLASESQIQQIIVNLANNALDAMSGGGTLTIATNQTTCQKKSCVRIHVRDTGEGIPEDIQSRVFEPFFTTKSVGKGTGLGLSLVYEIVTKHNGDIHLYSKLGCGTLFEIDLPLAA